MMASTTSSIRRARQGFAGSCVLMAIIGDGSATTIGTCGDGDDSITRYCVRSSSMTCVMRQIWECAQNRTSGLG
jgi:hypothetical protein